MTQPLSQYMNSPPTTVSMILIHVLPFQLNKAYISRMSTGHRALLIFIMDFL